MLRAEVLRQLVLRPWDTSRPAVTAEVTIFASLAALEAARTARGQAAPNAEVDGQPITAAHLKEFLAQLDAHGVQPPEGGGLSIAITDATGKLLGTATSAELRRLVRRGCATHGGGQRKPQRRRRRRRGGPAPTAEAAGSTDPTSTEADTDPPGAATDHCDPTTADDCGCPVLGKPPAVDRYRPSPRQRRFITTRDRTCRHPGCANQAGWADLDHVVPHAEDGNTDRDNLCCLCRRHHRLKTHAPGWRFVMDPDGTLTVTTPSGVTRTTRPPGQNNPDLPGDSRREDDPPPF
jgi:hypothetical protein